MRGTAEKARWGQAGNGALCAGDERARGCPGKCRRPGPPVPGHWLLQAPGLHAFPSSRASQASGASAIVSEPCAKVVLRNVYMYIFNPFDIFVRSA